jgi:hypothetical protein
VLNETRLLGRVSFNTSEVRGVAERLPGCYSDAAGSPAGWESPQCAVGGAYDSVGDLEDVDFVPHNLSGTYSFVWTVGIQGATTFTPITRACASDTDYNCIASGCTATTAASTSCDVVAKVGATRKMFSATLKLTQLGQSRSITAYADIVPASICCQ